MQLHTETVQTPSEESALKVTSGKKKPVMAPWNQTCLAFGLVLYQLKYPTPTAARLTNTLSEVPGKCSVGPLHDFRKAKGRTNLIHRTFKSQ